MDYGPADSSVHGILQARILEWIAIPFTRGFAPGIESVLQADSLPSELPGKLNELYFSLKIWLKGNNGMLKTNEEVQMYAI